MQRLFVLDLAVQGCSAQAWLNGIPVALASATAPQARVAVHEYTLAGVNRIEMEIGPRPVGARPSPAVPQRSNGRAGARLRLLLPRVANPVDEASARTLAALDWAPPDGQAYELPAMERLEVTLPFNFPRWRWVDAPVHEATPELLATALRWVQHSRLELTRGEVEGLVTATRLRVEEVATAYQRRPEDELERWRQFLADLCAKPGLQWCPVTAEDFQLRPLAGSRLFECLDSQGRPALKTAQCDDGAVHALPLRLAFVDGRPYVLR